MVMTRTNVSINWGQAQLALKAEVERVTRLLRSGLDASAPALGEWDTAGVAMHLSQAWVAVPGMSQQDMSEVYDMVPPGRSVPGNSLIHDIWDLADLTKVGVRSDPERNLNVLADRIQARAAAYFRTLEGADNDLRTWMVEGTTVPMSTLTGHLLNETVIHGWDIAHANGRSWSVDPGAAALIIEGFILPIFQQLDPRAMVNHEHAEKLRATFELRLRGYGRWIFAFDRGALTVEGPVTGHAKGIDCHISADPAAMLLVAWNRQSQWPAIASGKITAWGRKAWLGPRFRSFVRNP